MTDKKAVPAAEILDPDQCWTLLAETTVGRLAVIVDGHPGVFPVNYRVDDRTLVFRTGSGTKQEAIEHRTADPLREHGWARYGQRSVVGF